MGPIERQIRDDAAESLVEIAELDIRPMFSGYGFYIDGLLVAAAWDEAFRLRFRENGRWIYKPVEPAIVTNPEILMKLVQDRTANLSREPDARRHRH